MKFDEKEVIDSFDEEFSRKKKSADPKKTNGSIPMPKITPLIFVIGALVVCALSFLVLKLLKKEGAVPTMTPTAEISLSGRSEKTEAVVIMNDSATVIPLASATAATGSPETGSLIEEEKPSTSDDSANYSRAVSSTETQTPVPTMTMVSESDGAFDDAQPVSSTEIQAAVPTMAPVSESDGVSDAAQPVSSTEIQAAVPTMIPVSELEVASDVAQRVSSTEPQAAVPTMIPVSELEVASDAAQRVSSTEIQAAVPVMAPVSESDGVSDTAQALSSTEIQAAVSTMASVSGLDRASDTVQRVSSTETPTVVPTLRGFPESDELYRELPREASEVQNTDLKKEETTVNSIDNGEPFTSESVSYGLSVDSDRVEATFDGNGIIDNTSQKRQPGDSGYRIVNVNNVPVRLTEDTEISVPETETPVSASNGDTSPWTALSTPQPTDVPVFEILSAEEIQAISAANLSPTEVLYSSGLTAIDEQPTDVPASSVEVLPSPTATQPIPTETPVPTQTPMPTPTPDTRNWFEKMIDKVFRRESATPTAAIPTETEAAESLPPVERTEETPAVVAVESVPSLNPEHQPDEDPINAPVSVGSETQSDFDSDSSSLENRESPSAGIPSAPVSSAQSDNAQIATLLPAEAGKSLDPEPVYSPVDQNENHRNEGISDEKTVAAIGEKQSGSVSDEKSETGTAQIALPKAQPTGNTEAPLESEDVEAKAAAASTPNWSPDMNYATAVVMNLSDSDIISLRDMGILDSELIDDGPNETAIPTRLPETPEPTEEEVHATIVPVTRTKQPRAGKTQIAVSTSRTKTPVSKQAELPKTGGAEDLNLPLYAGLLAMLSAIVLILRALRKKG